MRRFLIAATAALLLVPSAASAARPQTEVRFSTFNASLNRFFEGQLVQHLSTRDNQQAKNVAETIQRYRPDVLLINEFDFDAANPQKPVDLFRQNYLEVSQNGAAPIDYPYSFIAPSNTGIHSGFDLNNNGAIVSTPLAPGYGDDAFGFGEFPGKFAMVVYSQYPIITGAVRTFQLFRWKDMPGALLPNDPSTPGPADWYSPAELEVFRLSSKSHWDVPIRIGSETVHFLVSHPTPPVFDGAEDRNGTRNHDEIRFWADYISGGERARYIYDDHGRHGGLPPNQLFVIAGDQNSDPLDGDSIPGSIQQLLDHPLVNTSVTPSSLGGPWATRVQNVLNTTHRSNPAFDTADFCDFPVFPPCSGPGNLRADYVLPRMNLEITGAGIFWPSNDPADNDPLRPFAYLVDLTGLGFPAPTSDHRAVWVDVTVPGS
jgi:Endonuclease/Exonuclease/phosphatase family